MVGQLGGCSLLCLTVLSACEAHGQADESALIQQEYHLHRFIGADVRARLVDKLGDDPVIRGYFDDLSRLQVGFRGLLVQHASSLVAPMLPKNTSNALALFSRQLPGMPKMPGAGGMPGMMGPDQMEMMEMLLDALDNDDFVRNFTMMSGEVEDLGRWFNATAQGQMALFLEASEGVTRETLAADAARFTSDYMHLEMDFFAALQQAQARFASAIPQNVFKKDVTKAVVDDFNNISLFVAAIKNMTKPNMTGVDGAAVYCPVMTELYKGRDKVRELSDDLASSIKSAKRTLPMIGRMFGQLMPEDDEEAQRMTPRLLFMFGLLLNSTESTLGGLMGYTEQMPTKLAPFLLKQLECAEDLASEEQSGAGPRLRVALAMVLSAIAAWLSAELL